MHRCLAQSRIPRRIPLNQMIGSRFIFLVTFTAFMISLFWIQLDFQPTITENLIQEALEVGSQDSRYSEVYRKKEKLSKDLKYILLWTQHDYAPFYYFEEGQRSFIKNNCSVINCYVTSDRHFFNGDLKKFDAIAFNGRNVRPNDLPKKRYSHQKYIYVNMESSENYPVCEPVYDDFFNWTATYKLNSDIPFPYLIVKNKEDEIVAPRSDMQWPDNFPEVEDALAARLMNKTAAAAWFVSNCDSKSGRDGLVRQLKKALKLFGLTVDIYGSCGKLQCPASKRESCNSMLERDYFFYMALENTLAEDYVTEKVLRPLLHDTVPIVYGGADYSRFLPPGSYIDARKYSAFQLAATMHHIMSSPQIYSNFFRWKSSYTYSDPSSKENVCALCAAMNDKKMVETESSYIEFRKWWNPNFRRVCGGRHLWSPEYLQVFEINPP